MYTILIGYYLLSCLSRLQLHVDILGEMVEARVLPAPPALTYPAKQRLENKRKKGNGGAKKATA